MKDSWIFFERIRLAPLTGDGEREEDKDGEHEIGGDGCMFGPQVTLEFANMELEPKEGKSFKDGRGTGTGAGFSSEAVSSVVTAVSTPLSVSETDNMVDADSLTIDWF